MFTIFSLIYVEKICELLFCKISMKIFKQFTDSNCLNFVIDILQNNSSHIFSTYIKLNILNIGFDFYFADRDKLSYKIKVNIWPIFSHIILSRVSGVSVLKSTSGLHLGFCGII